MSYRTTMIQRFAQAPSRGRAGFTLIELLVVLAIVAVMLTLAIPRYFNQVEASKETVLRENLRQTRNVLDRFRGIFPGVTFTEVPCSSPGDRDRYASLVNILTYHDHFLVTADFDAYVNAQAAVSRRWRDRKSWWRSSILNTARTGWFSSDRAIAEYAKDIWKVPVRQS